MSADDLIQNLFEALKVSPDNIPLKTQLANLLEQNSRLGEAEQQWKEIISLNPLNKEAKFRLADIYYKQQKFSVAIVILEELLESKPSSIPYLLLYSKSLLKDELIEKSRSVYQKIIKLDPQFSDEMLDLRFRQSCGYDDEDEDEEATTDTGLMDKPDLKFADVGGMDRVKNEIDLKIIKPLQHADLYKAYGKKTGGGILLYGPPGCGKTYLAKATAGEIDANFIAVGINDILDMWVGNSERNLHEMFELARNNTPCVLFFDEVDALGASRSDMRQTSGRHLINQFLSELDGVKYNNDGVLVLGATNAPWHLDPAFRRPGRFDRIIFVEPPDFESRVTIYELNIKGKPNEDIDYKSVAKKSDGFSGADIKAVVDICIESKLEESFKTGIPGPIKTKDLLKAVSKHRPSTKEWFNTAKNYALYANDAGLYDDILNFMKIKK
ncbi:MAG: AAA family ATPase [Bacteroidales bacterium]|nr:AAA family ATPase [Bacteroidales bacterium]MBN2821203.1 AAA family ATPase [Bacteroidales bacterium]